MRALIVGGGSIGYRHLQNLRGLGVEQLALVEPDLSRRNAVISMPGVHSFASLEAGLSFNPDFAVICSPTHLHASQALLVASSGTDLFVEKPLTHTDEHLLELCDLVERKRLVSLVGCNMRFHPGPRKVKELLSQERIGKVLFARVFVGSYLPDWRPRADYRTNYAARAETGGGCILDCIHEIDLCRWYLGNMVELFCLAERVSSLQIQTEDIALLLCRHSSGTVSEIHLDYIQRTYERGCHIVGEAGSILWDFKRKEVRLFEANNNQQWEVFSEPADWEINQMYVDEMEHFLQCVQSRSRTTLPVCEAAEVMQVAFAAKRSAQESAMVPVLQGIPA